MELLLGQHPCWTQAPGERDPTHLDDAEASAACACRTDPVLFHAKHLVGLANPAVVALTIVTDTGFRYTAGRAEDSMIRARK